MSPLTRLRLNKVLAMMSSPQDGEALAALRMAQQIIEREGMTLHDLFLSKSEQVKFPEVQTPPSLHELGTMQFDLLMDRDKIKALRDQLIKTKTERDFWQQQAKKAAEQLWDMGTRTERLQTPDPALPKRATA